MHQLVSRLHQAYSLLHRRPWLRRAAAVALLGAILLVWVVGPRLSATATRIYDWRAQEKQLDESAEWKQKLQQVTRKSRHLEMRLDSLYVRVPQGDRISVVLDSLQMNAQTSEVTITTIRPQPVVSSPTYEKLPLKLTVHGRFHAVARFVDRIERMAYLVVVDRLILERTEEEHRVGDAPLRARLQLGVITLRREPSALNGSRENAATDLSATDSHTADFSLTNPTMRARVSHGSGHSRAPVQPAYPYMTHGGS
jgi:Tfp pilus assembly protein PilO